MSSSIFGFGRYRPVLVFCCPVLCSPEEILAWRWSIWYKITLMIYYQFLLVVIIRLLSLVPVKLSVTRRWQCGAKMTNRTNTFNTLYILCIDYNRLHKIDLAKYSKFRSKVLNFVAKFNSSY